MSESFDDELHRFLGQSEFADTDPPEHNLEVERLMRTVGDELDRQGAVHIWHPLADEEQFEASKELYIALERAHADWPRERIMLGIADRIKRELLIGGGLIDVLIAREFGLGEAEEQRYKKILQARIRLQEFDDGWLLAADVLLRGRGFDPADPSDRQMLMNVSLSREEADPASLQGKINAIFRPGGRELHWMRSEVPGLVFRWIRQAKQDPTQVEAAENFLRHLEWSRWLTFEERQQLQELLHEANQ